MLFTISSFASQTKMVKDNATVFATVSIEGLTRISVINDRILNVKGQPGAYNIDLDNRQGVIFVQPTPDYNKKTFTMFIATEQNRNYVLHLQPKNQKSDLIVLKPSEPIKDKAEHWENASSYTKTITDLIHAMMQKTPPEGYVTNTVQGKSHSIGGGLVYRLKEIYKGSHLEGRMYVVANRSAMPTFLNENQFFETGDRAIVLNSLTIPPHSNCLLYKVVAHD